jgi:hypothetical protein
MKQWNPDGAGGGQLTDFDSCRSIVLTAEQVQWLRPLINVAADIAAARSNGLTDSAPTAENESRRGPTELRDYRSCECDRLRRDLKIAFDRIAIASEIIGKNAERRQTSAKADEM